MRKFIWTVLTVEFCLLAVQLFFVYRNFYWYLAFLTIFIFAIVLRANYWEKRRSLLSEKRRGSSYTTQISKESWDAYYANNGKYENYLTDSERKNNE